MEQEKKTGPSGISEEEGATYPASIEKMSEKWRSLRQQGEGAPSRGFWERHYLPLGIGIALLIIALLIVLGGFAFLVWNAR